MITVPRRGSRVALGLGQGGRNCICWLRLGMSILKKSVVQPASSTPSRALKPVLARSCHWVRPIPGQEKGQQRSQSPQQLPEIHGCTAKRHVHSVTLSTFESVPIHSSILFQVTDGRLDCCPASQPPPQPPRRTTPTPLADHHLTLPRVVMPPVAQVHKRVQGRTLRVR